MTALLMLAPGTLLHHRYEILRPLNGGGFSQVFEIRDGDAIKVLKVLDLREFSPSQQQKAIELFRREAKFLSQFQQRGVPQVEPDGYFVWQCDDRESLHCLVMEKVPGVNLQEWMQQNSKLAVPQAISWLHQLIEILMPLHQQQFFHRDIKPSNIMLRPEGQLMLIDFGTVREVSVTYLVKQEQQDTGTAIISAGYTPPEQAEGQSVPQSDFFALGRTMVALLTGTAPIDLPVDPQTGQLQWRDRAEDVPPQFADLLDRLMATLPGQRPQSGEAILKTIRQIERKLSWEKRLPVLRQVDRLRHKVDRRLLQFTPLKTALLLAVLFGGITLWQNRLDISDRFTDWGLEAKKANVDPLALAAYQMALLLDAQNAAALFNLGDLYETWQRSDQANVMYQTALSSNPENFPQLTPKIYNNLARLKIRNQHYQEGIGLINKGMALLDAAAADTETPTLRYALLKNLGWAQLGLKQYAAAKETLQTAISIDPNRGAAYCFIGPVYEAQNQLLKALEAYRQCISIGSPDLDDMQWVSRARVSVLQLENQPLEDKP